MGKGTLVATPSGKFHAACFTCDSCAIALTGDYMVSESGSPLCGNCADMIRGESGEEPGSPCMICGESIVEGTIVKAMIQGARMIIKGTSSSGTQTTDTYSLKGFTAAYKAINKACKVKAK